MDGLRRLHGLQFFVHQQHTRPDITLDVLVSLEVTLAVALVSLVAALVPGLGEWVAANVVRPFATYPKLGLSVLLVAVAVYYLGLLGRSRIERTYSRFWRRALPKGWRPKETAPPAREA